MNVDKISRKFESLKSSRGELNATIEELSNYLYPYTSKNSKMWDTTGSEACIKLSSLVSSLITPTGQRWHELSYPVSPVSSGEPYEDKRVTEWCDTITDTLFRFRERPSSGFTRCLQSFYTSAVECGTGCFYIEADENERGQEDGIRYIPVPFKDIYVSVNHQHEIDTVYREFKFTAEQVVSKWGERSLSSQMKAELSRGEDNKFTFIHAVYPKTTREKKQDTSKGYRFKNFYSKYVCIEEKRVLEEKELNTLPYVIGRFRTRADEVYGKSPAMEALPAIRRLNEVSQELAEYAALSLHPPIMAPSDGKQVDFRFKPRSIAIGAVSREGRPLFHPINLGNPHPYYNEIERIRNSIHSLFLLDLFQIFDDKASRSAAESIEKTKEKGSFVGPIIGRLQSEFLSHMVRREIDILSTQGYITPYETIDGSSAPMHFLRVEATSPLYKYQQAEMISAIYQGGNYVLETASKTGDAELLDVFDFEGATRFCVSKGGAPSVLIRDEEEVGEIRNKRRAQMAQAREQMAHEQAEHVGIQEGAKVAGEVLREKQKSEIRESFDG